MATAEQQEFLRSLEEEKSEPARRSAATRGRFMRAAAGSGLSVSVGRAAAQSGRTNTGPINFTVTFSAAATGFTNADISFAGSTVGGTLAAAVTGTNPYNVAVTGMTGNGIVQISVPAGSATDTTGKPFPASNVSTVMFDTVAPTVTINQAVGQPDPTGGTPINFTVVFNSTVTGFTASGVSFTGSTVGGTLAAAVTGSSPTYNVAVTGMTATGNVVASITAGAANDMAGNPSLASTSTDNTVAFDATWAALDGSPNAHAGTPQHPTLLNGYVARPPWQVAGVNYITGADATATKNPATLVQTGVSVNTSPTVKSVSIDNDDVILADVDFSNGGYQLSIGGSRAIVRNCKFSGGQGQWLIFCGGIAPTIEYCTIDGAAGGNPSGCIAFNSSGQLTLQYNWFKNFEAHILECLHANATPAFQIMYHFNMVEQGGIDPGAHLNVLQFGGGTCNAVTFEFNTALQGSQVASGGEWDQYYPNTAGGVITNVKRNYNTTVTQPGANLAIGSVTHGGQQANLPAEAHDNYYDLTNGNFPFYAGSINGWTLNNNVNMVTGALYSNTPPP